MPKPGQAPGPPAEVAEVTWSYVFNILTGPPVEVAEVAEVAEVIV